MPKLKTNKAAKKYPAGSVFPVLRCDDSGAGDSRKYPVCLGLSGRKKEKQQITQIKKS